VPRLKIATFNINGIRSRLPALLTWLQEASPDVVCLQELKAIDAAFPIGAINDAGYGAIWQGQSAWNGVAILAKGADHVRSPTSVGSFAISAPFLFTSCSPSSTRSIFVLRNSGKSSSSSSST
jgi:exodeoxyribonuclease-3